MTTSIITTCDKNAMCLGLVALMIQPFAMVGQLINRLYTIGCNILLKALKFLCGLIYLTFILNHARL